MGRGISHPWSGGEAGVERAKRSGGLHKRSAEDCGKPLAPRDRGRAPERTLHLRYEIDRRHGLQRSATVTEARRLGDTRRWCMPWKESCILDQRLQFLSSYQKEEMSVADLCRAYGISRPTAYRW